MNQFTFQDLSVKVTISDICQSCCWLLTLNYLHIIKISNFVQEVVMDNFLPSALSDINFSGGLKLHQNWLVVATATICCSLLVMPVECSQAIFDQISNIYSTGQRLNL